MASGIKIIGHALNDFGLVTNANDQIGVGYDFIDGVCLNSRGFITPEDVIWKNDEASLSSVWTNNETSITTIWTVDS